MISYSTSYCKLNTYRPVRTVPVCMVTTFLTVLIITSYCVQYCTGNFFRPYDTWHILNLRIYVQYVTNQFPLMQIKRTRPKFESYQWAHLYQILANCPGGASLADSQVHWSVSCSQHFFWKLGEKILLVTSEIWPRTINSNPTLYKRFR